MSLDEYLEADQANLEQIRRRLPHFRELMPRVHAVYERSMKLIPADSQRVFGRILLVCHKSFLSAAAALGRRHPDDAAASSRRAIEATTVALAFKLAPENLERWAAEEARLARWEARLKGEKPKPLHIHYTDHVRNHAGLNRLRQAEGSLSDAFVHFTPEYVTLQSFRETVRGDVTTLDLLFLEMDQRSLEREIVTHGDIHIQIVALLDECYDGAFSADDGWRAAVENTTRVGAALADRFAKEKEAPRPAERAE